MHKDTLRRAALILTLWIALHASNLRAQTALVPTSSNSVGSFGVDANGLLFDTGTLGTGTLNLSGAGTKMFWYPNKAAFRAGEVFSSGGLNSNSWDDANIGQGSVAFGIGTKASGLGSSAFGFGSVASGSYSTAFGDSANALGGFSMAVGLGASASGYFSLAFGAGCTASGYAAVAFGHQSTASGYESFTAGALTSSSGYASDSFGAWTSASGDYAVAFGYESEAAAPGSFVTGILNVGGVVNYNSYPKDLIFEVGNGTIGSYSNNYTPTHSDAFSVRRNGDVQAQGKIRCSPGGDISMGSFTTGTNPASGQP